MRSWVEHQAGVLVWGSRVEHQAGVLCGGPGWSVRLECLMTGNVALGRPPCLGPADLLAQPVRKKVTVEQRKYRLSGGRALVHWSGHRDVSTWQHETSTVSPLLPPPSLLLSSSPPPSLPPSSLPPAVVYHHGLHAAGGHYTSDVRLAQCGGWFSANDTHLKPLAEEQVLKGQCKEVNKVAYLLCYRRSTE